MPEIEEGWLVFLAGMVFQLETGNHGPLLSYSEKYGDYPTQECKTRHR
jgi:hypothetical protein